MRTQRKGVRQSGSGRPVVGRWGALLVGLVAALWQVASSPVAAQEGASGQARKWALLIGIEKYHRAPPLRYTVNDVRQLAETLLSRGDYAEENMLEIVDTEPEPAFSALASQPDGRTARVPGQAGRRRTRCSCTSAATASKTKKESCTWRPSTAIPQTPRRRAWRWNGSAGRSRPARRPPSC